MASFYHFKQQRAKILVGGYDEQQLDYVSNWTDLEGVDLGKLFDIYKDLTWQENQDNKDKAHSDMCEYMEAVENGEIEYL